MLDVLNLALPFFGLIFVGFACGRIKQIPDTALGWMNFFIVSVSLPALFYRILAQTPLEQLARADFILATTLATLSAFAAYVLEKKIARDSSRFGRGAVEGVAGPESANNAGAQTSFIPMLTLGIPGNAVMALMIGAMTIHGIQPGPQVMSERPQLFWGMVASMWIGNLMLLVINLPLIGIWVQLLKVPYRFLYLSILLFCAIGVYTIGNSAFSVLIAAFFGVAGYIFMRLECEPAPMILGFVLGPLMEDNLRRAMRISGGDPMIFLNRPISLGLLIAAGILLLIVALPAIRRGRQEAFQET